MLKQFTVTYLSAKIMTTNVVKSSENVYFKKIKGSHRDSIDV
jgi:hypothetical protein